MLHFIQPYTESSTFAEVFPTGTALVALPEDMLRAKVKEWYYPIHRADIRKQAQGKPLIVGVPLVTTHGLPLAGGVVRAFAVMSRIARVEGGDAWVTTEFMSLAELQVWTAMLRTKAQRVARGRKGRAG